MNFLNLISVGILLSFSHPITVNAAASLTESNLGGRWKTDFNEVLPKDVTSQWNISEIEVVAPRSLTVSEKETWAPDADIVWREDPLGDRYQQVEEIIQKAAQMGTKSIRGQHEAKLKIEVMEFHAISNMVRDSSLNAGVHNVTLKVQVFGVRSGKALTRPTIVHADLEAFTGRKYQNNLSQGITQKSRITNHVALTLGAWLGHFEDNRRRFSRRGR